MSIHHDMTETGSVKFRCEQVAEEMGSFPGFADLNEYRRKLLDLGLIGVDANGTGFGNLSIRDGRTSRFYITGSGTARTLDFQPWHCARVVGYDFARNWLCCEGSIVPSSESLTHAAVYESDSAVSAVIHVHDMKLWAALLHNVPTTPEAIPYGTAEMAAAVRRLFHKTTPAVGDGRNRPDVGRQNIFVMAGHKGGIVGFGRDLRSAFAQLEAHRVSIAG
jgi:ribulose-5-phosphate 4-epimerase/fuculose-1-phosphate aldolase